MFSQQESIRRILLNLFACLETCSLSSVLKADKLSIRFFWFNVKDQKRIVL